jgi:uncharacterized protein YkuJ
MTATRQQQIRMLRSQLTKLETEEKKEHKIEAYGRIILKLSSLVYSKDERSFLLSCVEDRIASGKLDATELEFVGTLKKKLSSQ